MILGPFWEAPCHKIDKIAILNRPQKKGRQKENKKAAIAFYRIYVKLGLLDRRNNK